MGDKVYDLAYHHNNPTVHEHTTECEPQEEDATKTSQFLRCLRVELDKIRKDITHEAE